jgi:hypothetical protein
MLADEKLERPFILLKGVARGINHLFSFVVIPECY